MTTTSIAAALLSVLVASVAGHAATPFPGNVERQEVVTGPTRHALWLDLEGDGDGDLALADRKNVVRILRNDQGTFVELAGVPVSFGGGFRLAAGDLDRDGDPDLVACSRGVKRRQGLGGCVVLLNDVRNASGPAFTLRRFAPDVLPPTPSLVPLLVDPDGDGDLDILLFSAKKNAGTFVRNDLDGATLAFARGNAATLATATSVADAAPVDREGRGTLLWVTRRRQPAQLLELDPTTGVYRDAAAARGLAPRTTTGGRAAIGDLDGDGLNDVVVIGTGKQALLFLQGADGTFTERPLDGVLSRGASAVVSDDFDRDGRRDIFVGRRRGANLLLRNDGGVPPAFSDVAAGSTVAEPGSASVAAVFRRRAACDDALDLVVASAAKAPTRILRFPDGSATHTVAAGEPVGARDCVAGTDGADRLVGNRVASVLRGGGGKDLLTARAGVTVMEGGPGADTFEADGGFAIIRLPLADIVAGETIHCGDADEIWIDTPLSRTELEKAGVVLDDCFEAEVCDTADTEFDLTCHGGDSRTRLTNTPTESSYALLKMGLDLGFAAAYDRGFGECTNAADCYAIGLDVCRNAYGDLPIPPSTGSCYPSDFDGLEGPIPEWCQDPFWARRRYDEVQALLDGDGRRLVVPVVVWLVRSEAATDGGGCGVVGQEGPPSIAAWHDSFAASMGATTALFATWGIGFDYAFRRLDVPADSPFVVDPDTDSCRVELAYGPGTDDVDAARTIKALLENYPTAYRSGQVNVYLSDVAPAGQSNGSGVSWNDPAKFIVLYGTAGALAHEIGHEIGLGHPYSNNVSASGVAPGDAESRDSWLVRPFPDPALDRVHRCADDAACDGVDASPGVCRKGPGAALGFCQNLKKDCAEDGDRVCDTPWDAIPCFQGVDARLLASCSSDDDCHKVSTFRGTSYLTACTNGRCRKVECVTNDDCGGDSWCADGDCINHKDGVEACCDLHTDRRPGFVHDACWERLPNGTVRSIPGVGSATTWPLRQNVMGYHTPRGIPKTLTFGQRDAVVCKLSYTKRYGQVPRVPRPDGEPCTLRPGGSESTYGPVGVTRKVPHGACASGICQVTHVGGGATTATCVASSCADGLVGATEASRDCGGSCPNACPTLRAADQPPSSSACEVAADCVSGQCGEGICQPTCSDGDQGGSELASDEGGAGFATGCAVRPQGATCRFEEDCSGPQFCDGDATCTLATDCPVNAVAVPCTADGDCAGGSCLVVRSACQMQSCALNAQCPLSGVCDLATFRCGCTEDAQCPSAGDSCQVLESVCTDDCVDGRCLGICRAGLGG